MFFAMIGFSPLSCLIARTLFSHLSSKEKDIQLAWGGGGKMILFWSSSGCGSQTNSKIGRWPFLVISFKKTHQSASCDTDKPKNWIPSFYICKPCAEHPAQYTHHQCNEEVQVPINVIFRFFSCRREARINVHSRLENGDHYPLRKSRP